MATFTGGILGENIKNLRLAAHLTREELGNFFELSDKTIRNIENNFTSTNQETISNLLDFFGVTLEQASKQIIKVPVNFRDQLQNRHAKNKKYLATLKKVPSIPYAIKYKLIANGELDSPKTIQQIKNYFDKIKWKYTRDAISNAININKDAFGIESFLLEADKKTFLYRLIK